MTTSATRRPGCEAPDVTVPTQNVVVSTEELDRRPLADQELAGVLFAPAWGLGRRKPSTATEVELEVGLPRRATPAGQLVSRALTPVSDHQPEAQHCSSPA
jgi:hypothetical protein